MSFNDAGQAMKVMATFRKFQQNHPRFVQFFQDMLSHGITEGCVLEIKLTRPDGSSATTNMKVQPSDMELVAELKNMAAKR